MFNDKEINIVVGNFNLIKKPNLIFDDLIIEFLGSLDTELRDWDLAIIVPEVVPSGLPVEYR